MIEFSEAVQEAIDWAAGREDTLIIVTADHETGGLRVTSEKEFNKGKIPEVTRSTGSHSGVNTSVCLLGRCAELY